MRIGAHISIAGGVHKAVDRARAAGCEAIQIFSGNPRGWKIVPCDRKETGKFRLRCREEEIYPVIIHSPYLINLSAPDETIYWKSLTAFQDDLWRSDQLGADGFVIHVGYHRGEGPEAGIGKMAAALAETLAANPGLRTRILIENTASAGSSLGHRFELIAEIMERSGEGERLGLCFDTCHAYVSGYDVATARGLDGTIEEIDRLIGLDRLHVVHFNDSKYGLGSRRDRHEHIGQGKIGLAGMRRIARHPALQDKIFIIETPKKTPEDDPRNVALLKSFRVRNSRATR
ncbi:MAG: deoxyribonuclease IV [PVC group bacterium]